MFGYQKRIFVTIGSKVINPHILQKYFGGHLGLYIFHQWDYFGLYYVVFYNILYNLNKNEVVTNFLNVYLVIHLILLDVMAPVERYWYRHLASTD